MPSPRPDLVWDVTFQSQQTAFVLFHSDPRQPFSIGISSLLNDINVSPSSLVTFDVASKKPLSMFET